MVDGIVFERRDAYYEAAGVAVNRIKNNGTIMRYTALDYNCDNLAHGLLHETLHHYFGGDMDEQFIMEMTDVLWVDKRYKKMFVKKIVELL